MKNNNKVNAEITKSFRRLCSILHLRTQDKHYIREIFIKGNYDITLSRVNNLICNKSNDMRISELKAFLDGMHFSKREIRDSENGKIIYDSLIKCFHAQIFNLTPSK